MKQMITIDSDYITLGQLLKTAGLIDTGGQAKWFLEEFQIIINGETENRRGKKLVPGDKIVIEGHGEIEIGMNS